MFSIMTVFFSLRYRLIHLIYASIYMYVSAHIPFSTTLFIDMNTIIFGSTRSKALGLREYEIQSSLKKNYETIML